MVEHAEAASDSHIEPIAERVSSKETDSNHWGGSSSSVVNRQSIADNKTVTSRLISRELSIHVKNQLASCRQGYHLDGVPCRVLQKLELTWSW